MGRAGGWQAVAKGDYSVAGCGPARCDVRWAPASPTDAASEAPVTTPTLIPPSDITEILKHIPHRYPFLLIDRMEACEPNQWVRVIKNVSHNEEYFAGLPVAGRAVPQLLLLESLAQAAGVLCHYSGMMSRIGKTIFFFAGFDKCRFGRDVVPGDQLLLECTMRRAARGVAKIHGRASVEGVMAVESDMTAVIRDMADEAARRTEAAATA
jgi:3-hydroxyacyl-[acyl-carrier-protein] dehydratase